MSDVCKFFDLCMFVFESLFVFEDLVLGSYALRFLLEHLYGYGICEGSALS